MKQVFVAKHPTEVHLVMGLLQAKGIEAEVRGEVALTPDTLPSVWVLDEAQVGDAPAFIKRYEEGAPAKDLGGASWRCASRGESQEPQFTECWHCGASRPSGE